MVIDSIFFGGRCAQDCVLGVDSSVEKVPSSSVGTIVVYIEEGSMDETVTSSQWAILAHTYNKAVRGLYCGDSDDMQVLVSAGLMESAGRVSWCPDEYFMLTQLGRDTYADEFRRNVDKLRRSHNSAMLSKWLHSSSDLEYSEWAARKKRNSRRYSGYLRTECGGTFGEFL